MDAPPVQYVTTSDGYNIAYCVSGQGDPLVLLPPNFYDTQQVWRFFPDWLQGLAARFQVIQYDHRGGGMSTRGLPLDITLSDYGRDLDGLIGRLNLDRVLLAAFGGRGHVAIQYAAAHPEQVCGLILSACTMSGSKWMPVFYGMLPGENWELFLRNNAPTGLPDAELRQRMTELSRTVTLEDWNAWMHALSPSDVSEEVTKLQMPVLVLHPRDFAPLPAGESMQLAAAAPDGRFVLVDGDYGFGEPAQALSAIDSFVAAIEPGRQPVLHPAAHMLSQREIEVLRLVAAGRSNQEIANTLVISLNTVRRHVSNVFDKTGAANRAEATSYAHRHGLI